VIRTLSLLLALRLVPVDTAVPNRQPQLAASDGTVALVFGSGHAIWFSVPETMAVASPAPFRLRNARSWL
jgi:hypothetical protein